MANKNYDNEDGVWRTIGGRRVFIRNGQSLADAMKESGKFSRVAKNKDKYENVSESSTYVDSEIADLDAKHANKQQKEWSKQAKALEENIKKDQETGNTANRLKAIEDKERYDRLYDKKVYDEGMSEKKFKEIYGERPKTGLEDIGLTEKQIEAGERLTKKAEQGAREDVSQYLRSDKTDFDNDEEFVNSLANEWGIDRKQAEKLLKEGKSIEENKSPGQKLNNLTKDNNVKTFADELKKTSESKVSQKKLTNEDIIKMNDDELQKTYDSMLSNYYSSKDFYDHGTENMLEQLNQEINNRKKEKGFTQKIDFSGTEGRHYTSDELKKMEENGIRPLEHSYTGGGWEGVNSDKYMDTKDQAKAINDAMKKKYPDVKIARKTNLFSGGSSIDFNIMSSDKDLFVSDSDIDKMGYEDLHDVSRSNGFEWWAKDNVPGYNDNHSYNIDDVRKYAKQSLAQRKTTDIQGVKGNEWYLNDYGKKVVSDLNKEANSYTYNDSDGMIDYFDHGTYMHISIGKWNKPYEVKGNSVTSALKNKAYQKYLKEHPGSKMTLTDFKKSQE